MLPIYQFRILHPVNSDFGTHNQYALDILIGKNIPTLNLTHPLYQIIIDGIIWITRSQLDADHASILLMVTCQVISALIIYFWMGNRRFRFSELFRIVLSVGLVIAAPIMALQPMDGKFYFGYIGLVNFHNPTIIMLRPTALLLFILFIDSMDRPKRSPWLIPITAFITIIATLVKPNFSIIFIPVLVIWYVLNLINHVKIDWKLILFGYIVPGAIILLFQYLYTYTSINGSVTKILFLPFAVESGASNYLPLKFILSIFFPLLILCIYKKEYLKDRINLLATLTFLLGVLQLYLLAESGNRLGAGNFRWGAQITSFILFVSTARYLWAKTDFGKKELIAITAGLSPHIIAGIIYWLHCLSSKGYG
jgi:hypothetical protein